MTLASFSNVTVQLYTVSRSCVLHMICAASLRSYCGSHLFAASVASEQHLTTRPPAGTPFTWVAAREPGATPRKSLRLPGAEGPPEGSKTASGSGQTFAEEGRGARFFHDDLIIFFNIHKLCEV